MNKEKYQVTAIVLTYKPRLDELQKTILSLLHQVNIKLQIIVSDDGSLDNIEDFVKIIFEQNNFVDYKFLGSKINRGTVLNYINALNESDGEYIKAISPGDYLATSDALNEWLKYMEEREISVSFCRTIYYTISGNKLLVQNRQMQPALIKYYRSDCFELDKCVVSNLVLCDCILGAAFLCRKDYLRTYLIEISGIIRLCEDYSYRLMLLDGFKIIFYDKPILLYYATSGISHKKKSNGTSFLREDELAFDELIKNRKANNRIATRVKRFYKSKSPRSFVNRIKSFIFFPGAFLLYLNKIRIIRLKKPKEVLVPDEGFLKLIGVSHERKY